MEGQIDMFPSSFQLRVAASLEKASTSSAESSSLSSRAGREPRAIKYAGSFASRAEGSCKWRFVDGRIGLLFSRRPGKGEDVFARNRVLFVWHWQSELVQLNPMQ